jgi:hypothetical protein
MKLGLDPVRFHVSHEVPSLAISEGVAGFAVGATRGMDRVVRGAFGCLRKSACAADS